MAKNIRNNGIWKTHNMMVEEKAGAENITVEYVFRKGWIIKSPSERAGEIYAYLEYGIVHYTKE